MRGILTGDAFQCHKTVDYSDETPGPGSRPQQCAGLMAVLHRSNRHSTIMQVAERLGALDPEAIDPGRVAYGSIDEARRAHLDGVEPNEG